MNEIREKAERLIRGDNGFHCHACDRMEKESILDGSRQRCSVCKGVLFESEVHFSRVLRNKETPKDVKKYLRKLLRTDWPQCEHCLRKFKNIDKHVARKHSTPARGLF